MKRPDHAPCRDITGLSSLSLCFFNLGWTSGMEVVLLLWLWQYWNDELLIKIRSLSLYYHKNDLTCFFFWAQVYKQRTILHQPNHNSGPCFLCSTMRNMLDKPLCIKSVNSTLFTHWGQKVKWQLFHPAGSSRKQDETVWFGFSNRLQQTMSHTCERDSLMVSVFGISCWRRGQIISTGKHPPTHTLITAAPWQTAPCFGGIYIYSSLWLRWRKQEAVGERGEMSPGGRPSRCLSFHTDARLAVMYNYHRVDYLVPGVGSVKDLRQCRLLSSSVFVENLLSPTDREQTKRWTRSDSLSWLEEVSGSVSVTSQFSWTRCCSRKWLQDGNRYHDSEVRRF